MCTNNNSVSAAAFFGYFFSAFFLADVSAEMPVPVCLNVAHRGFSAAAPENTLSAFKLAVSVGADGAECDVYKTKDGVLVISHDASTKRMTGEDGNVTQMTLAEIKKLNIKGGEKIPTLDEYLAVLKGAPTRPIIEIKQKGIAADVVDAVKKAGMQDVSVIISFNADEIKTVRKIAPNIPAALLVGDFLTNEQTVESQKQQVLEKLIKDAKAADTTILDLQHTGLTTWLVNELHRAGITVWTWTVDDPKRMNELLDSGAESITTNKPDVLAKVLKERRK